MSTEIRTRFAPSPTGHLHIGSLRTALFNWLWAKHNQGLFILRLEDTDQKRLVAGAEQAILASLETLGISWDFGPQRPHPEFGSCIQSQRLKIYRETVTQLIKQGVAYYDYTSSEQLESLRQAANRNKTAFIFRKNMAQLAPQNTKDQPVVRIQIDDNLQIKWHDIVKGQQKWQGKDIGDFIILKSDNWPTYHLANVVDDYSMQISHVIRADEWLSSTPKHLYLFDCLQWSRPQYVHVPPVLGATGGKKFSKRDNDSSNITDLLQEGYLPQALLNYLSLLGWNPKTEQEIFTIEELIQAFDISNIQVSGARFDPQRLDWFNGQHLRALNPKQRQKEATRWWPKEAQSYPEEYKHQVLELVYQRLKNWSQLVEHSHFFFRKPTNLTLAELIQELKLETKQIENLLSATLLVLNNSDFSLGDLELKLYQLAQQKKVSPSKYFMLLRLKITGSKVAPGLFATINLLGKKEVCQRIKSE